MSSMFSQSVIDQLTSAGWYEGRRVSSETYADLESQLFPAASDVLSEFGGLHVGQSGVGVDRATADVDLNPYLAIHLSSVVRQHEKDLGVRLFAVGEVQNGHCYLLIDSFGKAYLINDLLIVLADSFSVGLEKLLLGKV